MTLTTSLSLVFLAILTAQAAPEDYFTAAVYEHARYGNMSVDSPREIVLRNLESYEEATRVAKSKNADVILFPEYGIFPPGDRRELKDFLEHAPDPKNVRVTPCTEYETYSNRPILYALSCMAMENSIVVVANTGDIQPCEGQPNCHEDGYFHYNTNLVFDRSGTLIAKYYKEHLFFELGMDLPQETQDPIFETDFGTFAMFICFDIIYERMSQTGTMPGVDAVFFSYMWFNSSPLYTSIQLLESWAIGHNATLIGSNIQLPGYSSLGCGIFQGRQGAVAYTFNPDGISKLVVAEVAKSRRPSAEVRGGSSITAIFPDGFNEVTNDGEDVLEQCSYKILGKSQDIYTDFRCLDTNLENYTLARLTEPSGRIEACNNGMCCSLDYSTGGLNETFYLGVSNGTLNALDRYFWEEENCFIARCNDLDGKPCAYFPMISETIFYRARLTANFSTKYIYPSVVSSGMRLVPVGEWSYRDISHSEDKREINFESDSGEALIAAGFKARPYSRDPPFVR